MYQESTVKDSKTYYEYLVDKRIIPQAKDNKELIGSWMTWWPFSILWTIFSDILRRFYNWVIDRFMGIYNTITAHVFKGL